MNRNLFEDLDDMEMHNKLIDKFYKETHDLEESELVKEENIEFLGKLSTMKIKMDGIKGLDEEIYLDIDINSMVDKVTYKINKRKRIKDNIIFTIVASFILFLTFILTLKTDFKFLIYFQGTIAVFSPFILIPIAKHHRLES